MSDSSSDICNRLYTLTHEHNGKNVWLDLNGVPVFVVQDLDTADHILRRNHLNYHKNMDWFRQALGASRFSENSPKWEAHRDLTHRYFTQFDRDRVIGLACRHAATALSEMARDSATGRTTLDDDILRRMAMRVLIETFFDIPLDDTGIGIDNLATLIEFGAEYSFIPAGKTNLLYKKQLARLPTLRRQVLQDLAPFRDGRVPVNMLLHDMLEADRDPASGITLEHELLTFLGAGAETTAAAMGWACYLLARYPDIQDRLQEEARACIPVTGWKQVMHAPLLNDFISETLRLFPPSPIIARKAVDADAIGQDAIPSGQNILVSFIGIQHDQRLHPDPWHPHIGNANHPAAIRKGSGTGTAFSIGPRICGGKHFALTEMAGFLHTFLVGGRFSLTSDTPPIFRWKAQMLREGGHPVRLHAHV